MIKSDFHIHTNFSDGSASPEEMVEKAISMGYTAIGFSDHSYTPFDLSYCMTMLKTAEYCDTVTHLKKKYKDRIKILLGIEQDLYSEMPTDVYDYVIGSVHYLCVGNDMYPIDHSEELLAELVEKHFGGDYIAMCKKYFEAVASFASRPDVGIIGHFDIVTKFNEGGRLFSEDSPLYRQAALAALRKLVAAGKMIEINTGAMWRGLKSTPFPSRFLLEELQVCNGRVIFSSDAHSPEVIGANFKEAELLASRCGIARIKTYPVI